MAKSLQQKYNAKKKSTLEHRNVGFELTFEEYSNLINRATVCDYTGVKLTSSGKHVASIERIDASLPYRVDNCCMVSRHVNSLKDFVEKGTNASLKMEDIELISKIKEALSNKTREDLTRKYTTVIQERPHSDVNVTKKYLQFTENYPTHNLSFSKFKKLSERKTCCWSRKPFEGIDALKPVFITTSGEFDDESTVVVCKVVSQIFNKGLFTKDQLLRVVQNLVE